MKTVAIIPCTNQKTDTPGKAREVWKGGHFQLTLAHAERYYTDVIIMSYKYGFITPEEIIEPYDIDIQLAPAQDKLTWWWLVRVHIKELIETNPDLVAIYTGMFDHDRIVREFIRNEFDQVITPWEGLRVGERMQIVYDDIPPFDPDRLGSYAVSAEVKAGATKREASSFDASEVEWVD